MAYNSPMISKAKKGAAKPKAADDTQHISLRIRADHVSSLDAIAARRGTNRSAQIQMAVAEYIEKQGSAKQQPAL